MKAIFLLIPIFATLAISGCTGSGGGVTIGNGVKILAWEPDFSSVDSGDSVQLRLKVQNQGERDAVNVYAVLTGINTADWQLQSGQNGQLLGQYLKAPDKVQNVPGEEVTYAFKLKAPTLPSGVNQPYTANMRVYYGYNTLAVKPVTFVNENELRRLQDKGESLPTSDATVTSGPLNVKINTGKFNKVRDTGGFGFTYTNTFPITIDIENTGGGVVSKMPNQFGGYNPNNDYQVFVDILFPSNLNVECKNILSGSYVPYAGDYSGWGYAPGMASYGGSSRSGWVELWKGQDTSITCNLVITQTPLASQTENIIVRLFYDYYIDSKATITVKGYGY
jgi:hypothetical protein